MLHKSFIAVFIAVVVCASSFAWAENVYVTAKGKKYHKPDCLLIKESQLTELDDVKAKEQGYGACKKCFKEEKNTEDSE